MVISILLLLLFFPVRIKKREYVVCATPRPLRALASHTSFDGHMCGVRVCVSVSPARSCKKLFLVV